MNTRKIRQDFPIFSEQKGVFGIKKKLLIYFDNACNTLRPIQVVNAINQYYYDYPACAGRSSHSMGKRTTNAFEDARKTIARFLGTKNTKEIIFTKNATESINIVARGLSLKKGDIVLGTDKEHNSNLVPWLSLKERGIKHKTVPSKNSEIDIEAFKEMLTPKVKLVAMQHTSNLDGTSIPLKKIIKMAHANKSLILVDGAQSIAHVPFDAKKLGVDFLAFSGHKMLGPSGTGALYGKQHLLEKLKPSILGGSTVKDSTYDKFELDELPNRFEAGLQNYAGFIGFAEAIRYLKKNKFNKLASYQLKLNKKLTEELEKIEQIELIGPKKAEKRSSIYSFNIKGMDSHQVALMLDSSRNIAVRSGHHCVHSWFNKNKMDGSVRASFYIYNTIEEVEEFVDSIKEILKLK